MKANQVAYSKSTRDLSEKLNIKNWTHIKAVCDGHRSHVETYRVAYYNNETNEPELKDRHNKKSSKIIRKIKCLNDGEIFDNCTEAGKKYFIDANQVGLCTRGILKSTRGINPTTKKRERLRFAYLDASNNPMIKQKHNEPLLQRKGIPKIMLTNREKIQYLDDRNTVKRDGIFCSLAEYCRETGVPPKRASKYLKSLGDAEKAGTNKIIDMLGYEFVEVGTRAVRKSRTKPRKQTNAVD
ncbi:hypothetical protein K2X40_04025 [Candidatus Babeliales bacterium]|nr:hypothetical protein [Candidatus Babeliales bacterium]